MLKRNKQVIIRFTDSEYTDLRNKADAAGLKMSPLIRQIITGCEIKPRPPDCYKDLVREIAAIGNNINQITHLANSTGYVSRTQVEKLAELMKEIWRLVREQAR